MNIIYDYSSNKDDESIRALVLKIYKVTRSIVNPEEWIKEKIDYYNFEDSFENNTFVKVLLDYAKMQIKNAINELRILLDDISQTDLAGKYIDVISEDINNLRYLYEKANNWDELCSYINSFEFTSARGAKNVPDDLKAEINDVRDSIKKTIYKELRDVIFVCDSSEIKEDFGWLHDKLKCFESLVTNFSDLYYQKKNEKNVYDFNDIEHFALKILTGDESISSYYRDKFDEIMIDEYQDSNMIQEIILNSFAKNNVFMVGDVKQSIYKFRQARPELFLDKYERYKLINNSSDNNSDTEEKVLLFKNFRSNSNIIDQVNYVFEMIMSKDIGGIEYTNEEFLKFGADYYNQTQDKAQLVLIETGGMDDALEEYDELFLDSNASLEGKFIAEKIKSLVGRIDVYDKKASEYRKAEYRDFAVLLRNTVGRVEYISDELNNLNIPSYTDNAGEYFSNVEVQTILSVLRIIDNPIQDIPLVDVLKSQIGNFSMDELSYIRLVNKNTSFYEAMLEAKNLNNELADKVSKFIDRLNKWREKSSHASIWELLWSIYNETGFYYYVSLFPDGVRRQANLKLLLERAEKYENTSFKGLFNFLNYIDNIKDSVSDFSESKMVGENDNVVRIMSVHKSKGLEFPIVFLAGTDKQFNKNEKKDSLLLDYDVGFGVDAINYDNRIKYPFISKHAVQIKNKQDSLSEEMRILYVALTRAREKLFVTGLVKDADKAIMKYNGKISKFKLYNSNSLLDWIGYAVCGKTNLWDIKKVLVDDLLLEENVPTVESFDKSTFSFNKQLLDDINEQMNWTYHYTDATTLPNKISISEIKRKMQQDSGDEKHLNDFVLNEMPSFVNNAQTSGSKFGTLIHSILQKLDFKNYSDNNLNSLIKSLNLDNELAKTVKNKISIFSKSGLFNEICNAKIIEKEKSFNLNIKAREIYDVDTDDNIMVQGIIDLFFVNQDDELILVDYKTDNVESPNELIDRYQIQLKLYKRALEEILDKKVAKTTIYSIKFGEEIVLNV